jgi:hypothetical protein
MTIDEVNDDYGLAMKPFRVVACIAVLGRLPLLEHTIRRLYQKNGCVKVVCSGDQEEDKKLCESLGARWTQRRNKPLGLKWNSAFEVAKDYNPDAVLFVGSSDWLSDNWLTTMRPYVEEHGFAGVPGCYMADIGDTIRTINWKGYKTCRPERADETIGIGRMLSRRLIEAMDWQPFDPNLDNSLDWSMKVNAKKYGFTDYMVHDDNIKALSISTNAWPNKHRFELHWNNTVPSDRVDSETIIKEFPELTKVFK